VACEVADRRRCGYADSRVFFVSRNEFGTFPAEVPEFQERASGQSSRRYRKSPLSKKRMALDGVRNSGRGFCPGVGCGVALCH